MNNTHILLVEDNPADRDLIVLWLRAMVHFPHTIEAVTRLTEAQESLQTEQFNIILLDLSLPDSETEHTLTSISSLAQYSPLVVMTGLEDEETGIRAVQRGAQDYLVKQSLNGDVLVRAIRYAIARRQADEAQKKNESLKDELDHERELNELKDHFISIVSHEFRTPLAVIMVAADMLRKYNERFSEDQRQEKLRRIKHSVQHLTNLVENILLLGRSGKEDLKLSTQVVDIEQMVLDSVQQFKELPTTQQFIHYQKKSDCMPELVADKALIQNVISNLLSNACKYSAAGTTIHITLICQKDHLVLTIQDEGIGIPAEDLAQLFTPFRRASNALDIRGTGIGLVTVKEIVNAHGGRITVESQENQGSTFTITLPVKMG